MRIVIGEDEALLRRGIEAVLLDAGLTVVASEGDAVALQKAVDAERPDLLITDIRMPPSHTDEGLALALTMRDRFPQMAVMVLSQHVQRRYAVELLGTQQGQLAHRNDVPAVGGIGYLLKQRIADVDSFITDVRQVASGGTAIDPDVVAVMMARARIADSRVAALTSRQQEVLALMAEGRSNSAIAERLFITEKAVGQHTSRIYDVLNLSLAADAHRRVLAVLRYLNRTP